jgi:subtilase family protein
MLASALCCLLLSARLADARPVNGRLIVQLTAAGARAQDAKTLALPFPSGASGLDPRVEPLFPGASGDLGRFVVVRFRADRARLRPDLPGTNAPWLAALRGSPLVAGVEEDQIFSVAALPNDPYFSGQGGLPAQFHLWNPGGLSLEAARAWPFVPADRAVLVAVIDTGVDWHHPDLGGPTPPGGVLGVNAAEANGTPGVDDDGNHYVDDVVGWDFVELDGVALQSNQQPAASEDGHVPDADPTDKAGHGTEVAGLINAITNNATGIAGAAPAARILPVRVGWRGADGGAYVLMSFCASGLYYAAERGARVANCSWDSGNLDNLGQAIAFAVDTMDVVVVGSAGNGSTSSTTIEYLASHPRCVGVAGVEADGKKASASNYGSWVDVAAFYRGMPTTDYDYGSGLSIYRVSPFGGTSFSAPQVCGLAALLRAVSDTATAATVRGVLKSTAKSLTGLDPQYGAQLGGGLIDYARAVETLGGGWDAPYGSHGLLPVGASLAFFSDSTLDLRDVASGQPVSGWETGVRFTHPPDPAAPVFSAEISGLNSVLIWKEGTELLARTLSGVVPPGWPVSLTAGAYAPVLIAGPPAAQRTILVPEGTYTLAFDVSASGAIRHSGPWPVTALAAAEMSTGDRWLAGLREDGRLLGVVVRSGVEIVDTTLSVGRNLLPPVIGELREVGAPLMVAAASDSTAPSSMQRVVFLNPFSGLVKNVSIAAPPGRFLSLAGFTGTGHLEAVLVDSAGTLHLIDGDGNQRQVAAGGPLAGEVLCADLDGDFQSDLLALRADGTLLAWNAALEPLPGFPRAFPRGAVETPAIADEGGRRFVVVADTAGTLWSLPVGAPGGPAPWPGARGAAGRSGFLGFSQGTPVRPSLSTLVWQWDGNAGSVCWSGSGLSDLVRLRVRLTEGGAALWEGVPQDQACIVLEGRREGETLALEGQDRRGSWGSLGATRIEPRARLQVAWPQPNPARSDTRLAWSGAVGPVRVRVFDLRGRVVWSRTVSDSEVRWPGVDGEGRRVPPGLYFMRIADPSVAVTRRVLRLD